MRMVDFRFVRPHRGSQNGGFEELVVQLARRHPPPGAEEFRRIEGAGGDAGVEAIWLKKDGSAIGIQAKYFLRVRDIDWAQIDKSVEATLKHRPEVNVYQVAIACDLTDRGGAKGQGKAGWDAWDLRVKRWEAKALELGRQVSFEPITASNLIDWLGQPRAAGLARYWFDADVLSLAWFADKVRIASADLGERYTPDHHVVVVASDAFDGLARNQTLRSRLLRAVEATWKHRVAPPQTNIANNILELVQRVVHALEQVYTIADAVKAPATTHWDVEQWGSNALAAVLLLDELYEKLRNQESVAQESEEQLQPSSEQQDYLKYRIRKTKEALSDLAHLLRSVAFQVDASRTLLVTGEAGVGKSHLLAAEANRAVTEGRPALLFLGQQFTQGNPWSQCERSLGLAGWPRDELFGALDAAGEAAGTRTLVLVDAVNEGAGANLWRSHLAGFIESLAPYPNIAVAIACRTEYVPFAIPGRVLNGYPRVELRGFTTFEEQEAAAIQYLDRRGIVRPAGPLLAPEFSHPLFLKAASDSLLKSRLFAFPRGLRGALKILEFYLDSVGGSLLPASAEPADLSIELRRALQSLAQEMAHTRLDHVPKSKADLIVARAFAPRTPPTGSTWLEVLLRNGIVRLDPNPEARAENAFVAPDDVARIAFQRFQDHLFVQASINGATDAASLFSASGPLEWLVMGPTRYGWVGVFEALSIQIPEIFDIELVDALPGGAGRWWREWGIQEGFMQSVRWRAIGSQTGRLTFTDRSLVLLNSLDQGDNSSIGLLLEVAAVPEHPWNANLLHRNLLRWGLNQRDLRWSRVVAFAADDEEHPVHRLLKWANDGKLDHAGPEVLRLVAITLAWLFSSTSRYIRDSATRGLCRLLQASPSIHRDLVEMMKDVDDLYVLERLLAASYGAACQIGDDAMLGTMAATTFESFFKNRSPPQHLLARDYALGVLEVAQARGRLPAAVDLEKARPPFSAKAFRAPSQAVLEKQKDKVGDHSIIWSCGEHGDFGRYEIAAAVQHFSATKLQHPAPLSKRNRFDLFVAEVVNVSLERKVAFEALENASKDIWNTRFERSLDGFKITKARSDVATKMADEYEDAFVCLLNPDERQRYEEDASSFLFSSGTDRVPASFDAKWAQRWVTARAYKLGWTQKRFGDDQTPAAHGRQRARIERVGKKYQWIALYELLAWLSDTHWLKGEWSELPKRYRYPTDTSYQRDLDPTLVAESGTQTPPADEWWKINFNMDSICDDQLTDWATQNDPWHSSSNAIFRTDTRNEEWVILDSFQMASERFSDREYVHREIGLRREVFQFVHCLVVEQSDLRRVYDSLVSTRDRNARRWEPVELVDGPFLGEFGWRATWPNFEFSADRGLPYDVPVLDPIVGYLWESHLDASRPDGVRARLPNPSLLRLLGLTLPPSSPDKIVDHANRTVIVHHSSSGEEGGNVVAIRRDALVRLLVDHELGCLWTVSAERSAWLTGGQNQSTRRWLGGFISFDGHQIKTFDWEAPW